MPRVGPHRFIMKRKAPCAGLNKAQSGHVMGQTWRQQLCQTFLLGRFVPLSWQNPCKFQPTWAVGIPISLPTHTRLNAHVYCWHVQFLVDPDLSFIRSPNSDQQLCRQLPADLISQMPTDSIPQKVRLLIADPATKIVKLLSIRSLNRIKW